jgi:hypothetical protein
MVRLPPAAARYLRAGRLLALGLVLAAPRSALRAQARPAGAGRLWAELGVAGSRQEPRCAACLRRGALAGPSVALALGATLPRGWGVAVQGRHFSEFSIEYSQSSRYGVVLAQYSPSGLAGLTLNGGAGWGDHRGGGGPYANEGSGAVAAAGVALRLPRRSAAGLSVTADLLQALGGDAGPRPRLVSVGLGLNLAGTTARRPGR